MVLILVFHMAQNLDFFDVLLPWLCCGAGVVVILLLLLQGGGPATIQELSSRLGEVLILGLQGSLK